MPVNKNMSIVGVDKNISKHDQKHNLSKVTHANYRNQVCSIPATMWAIPFSYKPSWHQSRFDKLATPPCAVSNGLWEPSWLRSGQPGVAKLGKDPLLTGRTGRKMSMNRNHEAPVRWCRRESRKSMQEQQVVWALGDLRAAGGRKIGRQATNGWECRGKKVQGFPWHPGNTRMEKGGDRVDREW